MLTHRQSFTEKGSSVNKEVIHHNMKEKLITSQCNVYDGIQQYSSNNVSDFPVSPEMRKSYSLSHQRYKDDLEKTKKKLLNLIWFSSGRLRTRKSKKWSRRFRALKVALNHFVKRFPSKLYWLTRKKTWFVL